MSWFHSAHEHAQRTHRDAFGSFGLCVHDAVFGGETLRPVAHFMLGFKDDKNESSSMGMVALGTCSLIVSCVVWLTPFPFPLSSDIPEKGFESPETHASCSEFLRKYQQDMDAHAGASLLPVQKRWPR